MKPGFIPLWPGATADKVISATNAAGTKVGAPVAASGNVGRIRLRASGTPTISDDLDVYMQTGGNVRGYSDRYHSAPGATVRVKPSAGSDWYGYTQPFYLAHAAMIGIASVSEDYPGISTPRTVEDAKIGAVRIIRTGAPGGEVEYIRKASPRDAWTAISTVALNAEPSSAPALIYLPSGRMLCYYVRTDYIVVAMYSDDEGTSWGAWGSDTLIDVNNSGYHLSAEVVGDEVCIVASKSPGEPSESAYVYWSSDRGQSFGRVSSETWGPARTCVTKTGVVLCVTTNQVSTGARVYYIPPGGAPGVLNDFMGAAMDADDGVGALVTMDDGTIWLLAGGNYAPAPLIEALYSRDHGVTWNAAYGTGSSASEIWRLGVDETTPYGLRAISAGEWHGSIVVLGCTQGSTADYDDSLVELHFGGWDTMTQRDVSEAVAEPNGYGGNSGAMLPLDTLTVLGWTKTDLGAGATVSLQDDGLRIIGTGAANTYYTSSAYLAPTNATATWRFRYLFKVAADGSIADDRAIVRARMKSGGTPDYASWRIRHSTDQIRILDHAGTLATTVSVANKFSELTEVVVFIDPAGTTLSAYFRVIRGSNATDVWTALVENQSITSTAGTPQGPLVGGVDVGAVEWYVSPLHITAGSMGYETGYSAPSDLAGRSLESAYDVYAYGGYKLGAAGGGGVGGDTFTVGLDAVYSEAWIWRDLRPSAQHRSTGDNATHTVILDAGAATTIQADWIGLIGTNFRTATWQMHTANSWATPAVSVDLDATLYAGAVLGVKSGLGFVGVDGSPWVPHQWQSREGARVYVEVGGVAYEVDDSDEDRLYVDGVDFSAASGALYVYGDRMAARLPAVARYRYARALITAQQTADDDYRIGTVWAGRGEPLEIPYASGFTWSDVENVGEETGTGGYGVRFELGPTRRELRIAWDPIDALTSDQVAWLRNLYRALSGRLRPVAFGDMSSRTDWGLYTLAGPLAVENVYGEGGDALERVSQIILRQVL